MRSDRILSTQRPWCATSLAIGLAAGVLVWWWGTVCRGAGAKANYSKDIQPVVEKFCLKCHGKEKPKGGVNLARFDSEAAIQRDPGTWEKVLRQMKEREMPPEGKPQPSMDERDRLVSRIEHALEGSNFSQATRDPGLKVLHRLNRAEYNHTVRDLFGVDIRPADKFPGDAGGGGGFDNNASTLYVPPLLMEKYLGAADEVLAAARPEVIFTHQPGWLTTERGAARKILAHFAWRAYRRTATSEDIRPLLSVYDQARKQNLSHETGVKLALKAILISPHFLFRVEQEPTTTGPWRINDFELATRLSYFLWSSMPDEELFWLASWQKLREPRVLRQQLDRMLRDPKARALAANFTGQWLGTRRLETSVQPDPQKFRQYTASLREAMETEPVEFFHNVLKTDASILEFLDSDHTFVNRELAELYEIPGVQGNGFRKVNLPTRDRGGVLGMAGVLTLTSYPLRTSPVLRGKWVLEEILGTPPPPPPPLVKSLDQNDRKREGKTFRQRLEEHRAKPECASCHRRMDPLGFGLENFDAIGRWRTEIGGEPLDASGELHTGEQFRGPAALKLLLLARKDQFTRTFTEKLLAYALGRGLEYYDRPTIKAITASMAQDGYRVSTLLWEIINSYPFQYQRGKELEGNVANGTATSRPASFATVPP